MKNGITVADLWFLQLSCITLGNLCALYTYLNWLPLPKPTKTQTLDKLYLHMYHTYELRSMQTFHKSNCVLPAAHTQALIYVYIYIVSVWHCAKWLLLINNFINWPLTTLWPHYQAISTSNLPQKLSDLQQILHNNFLATKADLLHTRTHIHTWLHISINFFANTPAQVDIYLWRILHPQAKEKGGKDSI